MRLRPVLALLLLVGGCVGEPTPPPVPRPATIAVPAPRPAPAVGYAGADWRDRAVTPGDWVYRSDARGSIALFGAAGGDALLTLRCDQQAHLLYLSRQGTDVTPLTVRTSSLAQTVAMQPTGGTPAYVATALVLHDLLLDQIAFSRGRFIVEQPGATTLVVPVWAEIGRVIEDCRR